MCRGAQRSQCLPDAYRGNDGPHLEIIHQRIIVGTWTRHGPHSRSGFPEKRNKRLQQTL